MKRNLRIYDAKSDANEYMSPHFKVKEFACKDGARPRVVDLNLIWLLEGMRIHYDKPVFINSGYRTVSYNKTIGGASNSMHTYGIAADIQVSGVDPADVYAYLNKAFPNSLGLGKYNSFTHVDIRDGKARWNG